jgi:heterotetrameric sarcosine oxidase gamma subunit
MLDWAETLQGPRSLMTGSAVALVTIEDPGLVEIRGRSKDRVLGKAVKTLTGAGLPSAPWSSTGGPDLRLAWRGPDRWWLLLPRAEAAGVSGALAEVCGKKAVIADLTGSVAALRLVGKDAGEALARTCALDLRQIAPLEARGTAINGMAITLLREAESVDAWLILVARSFAQAVAQELGSAIKTSAALDLFGDRVPPV